MMGNPQKVHIGQVKRALLLEALRKCGAVGGIASELCIAADTRDDRALAWLYELEAAGLAGSWPDPIGRCMNRRRWWLTEFRPTTRPAPSGLRAGLRSLDEQEQGVHWRTKRAKPVRRRDGVLVVPGYTHDPRYQVEPGAQVYGAGFAALGVGRYLGSGGRG